ncbi:hypothetical protein BDW74DRAFT_1514 [Aspergillus multicolor]|uniref:uncharacterized protein n=1 Tax=Aspergillus multicolor TaxID=41759 RepID=UPI003CCDDDA5
MRDRQQWCSSAYWAGFGFLLAMVCFLVIIFLFCSIFRSPHSPVLSIYTLISYGHHATWLFDGVDIDMDGALFLFHCPLVFFRPRYE